jgi:2-polyprenyl-3-methyl-5-hydroxy-6-metoxy-1,4-benzoquinol methylase
MHTDFNAKAASWDDDPRKRERAAAVAAQIRSRVPLDTSMEVLEFGCGTGLLGFELFDEVGSVCFADPAQEMLNEVKRKLAGGGAEKGSTLLLTGEPPELPRSYDLIVSLMTLHHVTDVTSTLTRLSEHLKPGGYLALCDLDPEDGSFHDGQGDVHPGFDRGALIHLLALRGLTDFVASTAYEVVEQKEHGPRHYPLFLITGHRPS